MKKYLIATVLLATLALPSQAAAQKHRHTPLTTVVADSTQQQDEVEAFSDTTSLDSGLTNSSTHTTSYYRRIDLDEDDVKDLISDALSDPSMHKTLTGGLVIIGILLVLFVLAPLVILGLLFFFIYKNRKQKVRLAEAAMRNGQPIPDRLFDEKKPQSESPDQLRARGIRQTCLGIGLMIFLGYTAGNIGFGVGALVTAIGVGNLIIAHRNF